MATSRGRRMASTTIYLLLFVVFSCGDDASVGDAGASEADAGPATGAACVPENVPSGGFSGAEVFLETSSAQCHRQTCLVYELEGDPSMTREACIEDGGDAESCESHPVAEERDRRVHCTCRCAAPTADADTCTCPSGFACTGLLGLEAGPDIAGSYCVREAVAP